MDSIATAVDDSLQFLIATSDVIVAEILSAELWLRQQMIAYGAPPIVQTSLLICLGAIITLASTRILGGAIRVALVMMLALTLARVALPVGEP